VVSHRPDDENNPIKSGFEVVEGLFEVAKTVVELKEAFEIGGLAGLSAGSLGLAVSAVVLSVKLETFPADLTDRDVLAGRLSGTCAEMGGNELFLPICRTDQHSQTGDDLFDAGFWHGSLHVDDFESARLEAVDHHSSEPDSVGRVGVVSHVRHRARQLRGQRLHLDESAWARIDVDLATLCNCSWFGESASRGAERPLRNLGELPSRYGSG
jgi:hypothetical protein